MLRIAAWLAHHRRTPTYPHPQVWQAGRFRADGFIMRSQLEMLLAAPDAYCDAVGACKWWGSLQGQPTQRAAYALALQVRAC